MYFALKKNLAYLLLIISIIAAIPCTVLSYAIKFIQDKDENTTLVLDNQPFITKISVGFLFGNDYLVSENLIVFVEVIVYLNAAAIIYMVFHSIYLRRMLISFNKNLDSDLISPSDYTCIVKGLPMNLN